MTEIKFDYSRLRGRIREKIGTETEFATLLGISAPTLSAKLNNKVGFTESEILKASEILLVPRNEISFYFFCKEN